MSFIHLIAILLLAQASASTPKPTVTVQGIVSDTRTGDPLPSVQVRLTGSSAGEPRPRVFTAFTAADGRFSVAVPPAEYTAVVQRPGYFGLPKNDIPQPNVTRKLIVTTGQPLSEQRFGLTPAGVVTGRIFDDRGRPGGGLTVALSQVRYRDGRPNLSNARSATTDEFGEYRIYWVPPGDYIVMVEPETSSVATPTLASGPNSSNILTRTFYPGTTQVEAARLVTVSAGSEVKAIDFGAKVIPSFKISGRVINPFVPQGGPPPDLGALPNFTLVNRDSPLVQELMVSSFANAVPLAERQVGLFELRGIPAGRYDLYAQVGNSGRIFSGSVSLDLNSQDVKDITISVRPPVELRGRIVTSGNVRLPEDTTLSLLFLGSLRVVGLVDAKVDANGEFAFKGLMAGTYRLLVPRSPDTFIADIRQGDRSIYNDALVRISDDTPETLQVMVAPNSASLSGTFVYPDGKKGVDTTVVLVPDNPLRGNFLLYRSAQTDGAGQFSIENVAPGRYKLFAWESVPTAAWQNSQFLAKHEDAGIPVPLAAGKNEGLRVPVIWLK